MKKPKRSLGASMDDLLRLPAGTVGADCKIQLIGNREMWVEGCHGVLEYDSTVIRLHLGRRQLKLTGSNLSVRVMDRTHAEIEGNITCFEFVG